MEQQQEKVESCAGMMKEIAALEVQILHLESHLLSLYRAALPPHVAPRPHRSLAHHLGTPHAPSLSQHILACISSIYSKFASATVSWSPGYKASPLQVTSICLDDHTFKYAATTLRKFRSLVASLAHVDPGKLKREEKLAFWLNLHNALLMHGYLAYGTHNLAKTSSIFKAAYDVGGHCINAHIIQTSILGIRSHYSPPWIHTVLSPKKKKAAKHIYCLEYPEPLVHFALSSGSSSDPPVRVYTPNSVFQDLKLARDEFIQATLEVHKGSKLYLPKPVHHFGSDMSMSAKELLETVCSCVGEVQQKAVRACIKGREDKCVSWIPMSSTFQFLIHKQHYLLDSYTLSL